eukprot:TRINITY_DN7485_c0_g1_i1.p1 TRINITY_DN7485_c0_g1~~TRINITY_DN7485_c0_g1_i1.p1  ORF type:complete len:478 (-),score=24.82 TRINITY_DN7485_c0_g1_i1:1-1434(-)
MSVQGETENNPSVSPSSFGSRRFDGQVVEEGVFGIIPWRIAPTRTKKIVPKQSKDDDISQPSNYIWLPFGIIISISYLFVGSLLYLSYFGIPHAHFCWRMSLYYLWPFGKFIIHISIDSDDERRRLLSVNSGKFHTLSELRFLPQDSDFYSLVQHFLWLLLSGLFLIPLHIFCGLICWFLVFLIPMANLNLQAAAILHKSPLRIEVHKGYPGPGANVVYCTYSAVNFYYFKYSVFSLNVVLVNLLPFVILSLIIGYLPTRVPALVIFIISAASILPLTYYIGLAVSSLVAQTSFLVAAIVSAVFGFSVELIIYITALFQPCMSEFVQSGVIGSLLAMMLLLPGLSMVAGGIKYKEQRFNPTAAGVTSVLLLISIIGSFTPTVFYMAFGSSFELTCDTYNKSKTFSARECSWQPGNFDEDPIYIHNTRPLMYCCASLLPFGYVAGLIFTFKTHSHLISHPKEECEEAVELEMENKNPI